MLDDSEKGKRVISLALFRALLFQADKCPTLNKHAKKILLAPKPAPILESILRSTSIRCREKIFLITLLCLDHGQYTLGTLSYVIGQKANGYKELPDFPLEAPDPSVRNVEILPSPTSQHDTPRKSATSTAGKKKANTGEKFYSDEDEEDTSTEGPDDEDDDDEEVEEEDDEQEDNEEEDEEGEDEEDDEDEDEENAAKKAKPATNRTRDYEQLDARLSTTVEKQPAGHESSAEESDEEEDEEESESEESSEEEEDDQPKQPVQGLL